MCSKLMISPSHAFFLLFFLSLFRPLLLNDINAFLLPNINLNEQIDRRYISSELKKFVEKKEAEVIQTLQSNTKFFIRPPDFNTTETGSV